MASATSRCVVTRRGPVAPRSRRAGTALSRLATVSDDTILVSLADKFDNTRATLRDLRNEGPSVWERFTQKDPREHLWYYNALVEKYESKSNSWMLDELKRTIALIEREIDGDAARKQNSSAPGET